MIATMSKPEAPSDDKRWAIVQATMRRNGYSRNALIETLHTVQSSFGFLDEPSLRYVASSLRVPLSGVYGVATFYHLFTLKPQGKHACIVCTGTACYIKGATQLLDQIHRKLGVGAGETTADGKVSVLTARCIGACSMAPAVVFDEEMTGNIEPAQLDRVLEKWGTE
jgi:bidirectional [NiFe] hydrogenase diaphorase subunit